ncbi:hypothetical protein E2C01_051356 [Portunus trituberculatus]|uniref:RNase H type-1 domain-containing protein n=1 Tax=Portunus trituberculatus TaxID=210409 RepID=A0A5B7GJC2_PORTR|nr:hypothetical protein [Portunus trituberculatus]
MKSYLFIIYVYLQRCPTLHEVNSDLVNKCLHLIHALEGAGATVHFTWIPSHVGIPLNEKADRLAQCTLQDGTVDPGTEHTLGYVKSSITDFVHNSISDQLELCCHRGSGTSLHYARTCLPEVCLHVWETHSITRQGSNEAQIRLQNTFGKSVLLTVCVMYCVLHQGDTLCVTISWHVLSLLNSGHKVNMTCIA